MNGEVEALKRELAEQKKQIEELRQLLLSQKKPIDSAKEPSAPTGTTPVHIAPNQAAGKDMIASAVPMVPSSAAPAPTTVPSPSTALPQAGTAGDQPSPLQFKLGDAYITPVGFMDLTNTYRSTNAGTSLQTNFGSIPYNNVVQGRLSENKLSAANSRTGLRVDAIVKGTKLLAYYEGDFVGGVGNGAFNTQVSSNSLLYRIRLYWVDARKGKFEMLAGQSWSMLTPNRKQISALPADLFYSQVVDVNYVNGLTWGRIPGIRFLYHPTETITMGISLENASQYFGGSGGEGVSTLPAALTSLGTTQLDSNLVNGVAIPNVHPDIIGKIAFDPSSRLHFEVAGVVDTVKLFNPNTHQYFTESGVGGSVNANFELFKGFRLVTNNFWSDGAGRFLFGEAPNFMVRADGSPSMIHSGSTVTGFEFQRKNTQIYSYYGGIYISRNTAYDLDGKTRIGYGFPGSSNSNNKTTQEGTVGLIQTVWKDPKFGSLQVMLQYAYFFRNPWFVAAGAPRNAHENVVWFNLRYVLPGSAPTLKY
jgi:hypothetical protein